METGTCVPANTPRAAFVREQALQQLTSVRWRYLGRAMAERLVHDETPMEYFRQLVEGALAHQRVHSSEHTTFYVVNLLAAFVCPQRDTADALQEPLARS